jgi:hypothetical protein
MNFGTTSGDDQMNWSISGMSRALAMVLFAGAMIMSKPLHAATECASIFQAAEVARSDFADRLKRETKAGTDLDSFVENLDNYSVGISTEGGSYFVIFKLRKTHRVIFGGVAYYEIRKKDLAILRFHQEE